MESKVLTKKKVLIVDDELPILQILTEELELMGIQAIGVVDGREALGVIQLEKPDLIISDYQMPGLNGIELLKFMGDLKITTPVIWLSGHSDSSILKEAWKLGVYDCFGKPFKADEIAKHVQVGLELTKEELIARRPSYLLNSKHFEQVTIDVDKEVFEKIKTYCLDRSISITSFLGSLIRMTVDSD